MKLTKSSTIAEVENQVYGLHLTMAFVMDRAGLSRATWSRWKSGSRKPTPELFTMVVKTVNGLENRLARKK